MFELNGWYVARRVHFPMVIAFLDDLGVLVYPDRRKLQSGVLRHNVGQ
jgi:hypothetical protein